MPRLGHVPLRKLTAAHIEAFEGGPTARTVGSSRARRASKRLERGLSAQTVLHVHRILSQALNHAVRLEVLIKNPAKQVKPPRPTSQEIKILSKQEIAALLEAAKDTPLYVPVLVAVTTDPAWRLLGLRWSDIDLKAGRLTVNQAMQRTKGELEFKSPKTKTSRRTITLPAVTVEALQAHHKAQLEDRMKLGLGAIHMGWCSRGPMASRRTPTASARHLSGWSLKPR